MTARWILLASVALAACGCSSVPPAARAEGEEEITMQAQGWLAPKTLFDEPGLSRVPGDVAGVRCTFSNDKGTWTVAVPGKVKVKRSLQPLVIDCEGGDDQVGHAVLKCVSPQQKAYEHGQRTGTGSMLMVPAIIVATVLAPPAGAAAAAKWGVGMAISKLDEPDTRGLDPDLCSYAAGRMSILLTYRWP